MKRLQLRYSQKNLQASLPEIGIFWIIYDKDKFPRLGFEIFGDTISIKEAKAEMPDRAILDTPAEHYRVWNSKKNEWGFPYDEYEEHPRGRVVYRRKNSTFYIICGRQTAKDPKAIEAIKNYFGLNSQNVKVKVDIHYNLNMTQDEIWEDFFNDE